MRDTLGDTEIITTGTITTDISLDGMMIRLNRLIIGMKVVQF